MLRVQLNYIEKEIVKDVCDLQIQSLMRTGFHKTAHRKIREAGVDISIEAVQEEISSMIKSFSNLRNDPERLAMLDDKETSLVIDHLFNMDEEGILVEKHKPTLYRILFRAREANKYFVSAS